MKIIRINDTDPADNRDALRHALAGRHIENCGIARFEPGHVAHAGEDHRHDHDEIFIILEGQITVPIGPTNNPSQSDTARTGDWVLVSAGEEHHLTNHTTTPCTAMFLIAATH